MNTETALVYTIPQVATLLGLSKSHTYRLARDQVLPAFKLGNR